MVSNGLLCCVILLIIPQGSCFLNFTSSDYFKEFLMKYRDERTSPCEDFYRHVCPYTVRSADTQSTITYKLGRDTQWRGDERDWWNREMEGWNGIEAPNVGPIDGTDNLSDEQKRDVAVRRDIKTLVNLKARAVFVHHVYTSPDHLLKGFNFDRIEALYDMLRTRMIDEIEASGNPRYTQELIDKWRHAITLQRHSFGLSDETKEDAYLYMDVYKNSIEAYERYLREHVREPFTDGGIGRTDELLFLHDNYLKEHLDRLTEPQKYAIREFGLAAFNEDNFIVITEQVLAHIYRRVPESVFLGIAGLMTAHELHHSILSVNYLKEDRAFGEVAECQREHYERSCMLWNEGDCHSGLHTFDEDACDIEGFQLSMKLLKELYGTQLKSLVYPDLNITTEQMYFYGTAVSLCENRYAGYREDDGKIDDHSLFHIRINALFSSSNLFKEAFQCKSGEKMVQESQCNYFGEDVRFWK